jgi:hypothetical protein
MKTLRQITLSIVIAGTLCISVAAQQGSGCIPGDMASPPCSGAAQSLPPDQESTDQTATTVTSTVSSTEIVAEVAVDLVETLLAIF